MLQVNLSSSEWQSFNMSDDGIALGFKLAKIRCRQMLLPELHRRREFLTLIVKSEDYLL